MKVLLVGGAGYVGSILRPAIAAEHDCICFDRHAVESPGSRSIVGDVNDDHAVRDAVAGVDAIVYLAMGVRHDRGKDVSDIGLAFDVNVQAVYRFLRAGLAAGARCFVYASTLSVYNRLCSRGPIDEELPADCWEPYGLSKRLGEDLCQAAAMAHPRATIIALRLMQPRNELDYAAEYERSVAFHSWPQGPADLRRLFLAAIRCDRPGAHIVQTTGDIEGHDFPCRRATELLGWSPRGE